MKIINLRDYYPFYQSDFFIDVPDEIAELFRQFNRKEHADFERRRIYMHIIPLMLATTLKKMLYCLYYHRKKSMSEN